MLQKAGYNLLELQLWFFAYTRTMVESKTLDSCRHLRYDLVVVSCILFCWAAATMFRRLRQRVEQYLKYENS